MPYCNNLDIFIIFNSIYDLIIFVLHQYTVTSCRIIKYWFYFTQIWVRAL